LQEKENYEVTSGELFLWRRPSELAPEESSTKVFSFLSIPSRNLEYL
jgi:hypothetical protein